MPESIEVFYVNVLILGGVYRSNFVFSRHRVLIWSHENHCLWE